jgi:hypothetical protein
MLRNEADTAGQDGVQETRGRSSHTELINAI